MNFKCRIIKPSESSWMTICTQPDLIEAVQAMHALYVNPEWSIPYDHYVDGKRQVVRFCTVEVEGHGEYVVRSFTTGIFRKGGILRQRSLKDIAKELGWAHDPQDLVGEGWDGEESYDEAETREKKVYGVVNE